MSGTASRGLALLVVAALAGLVGCSGDDDGGSDLGPAGPLAPQAACDGLAAALCAKSFECYTAAERAEAFIPDTEEECAGALRAELGCASQTEASVCEAGTYDPEAGGACVDEYRALSCDELRAGPPDEAIPSCTATCG